MQSVKWKGGMYGGHYTAFAKCESIVLGNSQGGDNGDGYALVPDAGEVRSTPSSWDTDSSKVSLAGQLTLKNKVTIISPLYIQYMHAYIHTTFIKLSYIHTYICFSRIIFT